MGTVRPHLSAPQILSSLIYPVPLLYPQFNPERVFVDKGGLTTYWLLVIQFITQGHYSAFWKLGIIGDKVMEIQKIPYGEFLY